MGTTPVAPLTQSITEPTNHVNSTAKPLRLDAPDDGRYVSEEEYWAIWYEHPDASYEWNNGYLEAKPLSNQLQFRLYKWFLILLEHYLQASQSGQMMGLETGFVMTVPNLRLPGQMKRTVRKPDIAVIRHDNAVQWGPIERSYRGLCDLCIEALSDSTKYEVERDTKVKKAEYEFAGVQEYYILDPAGNHMRFYQRTASGSYVEIAPDTDGVIRSTILPGFQFRVRDLYDLPSLETLARDAVYETYILLYYQAALAQAELERQRAAEERQRAEKERQRAEAELAARQLAEAQAAAEVAARQAAEAELARLRAELAQLRGNAL